MSICVKDLSFAYGDKQVLHDVSFCAKRGELLSVLGPNGVGKSTLFRCMLGLHAPTKGQVLIDGCDIAQMNPQQLARRVAYIPQSHAPVFNFKVIDMVLMGTTAQTGHFSSPGKAQQKLAQDALERLGIGALQARSYGHLSGGERQMVLIARAIAQQADVLVMDEPSSSLDFGNRIRLMRTIKALTLEGYAVIQSTHDPDQAFLYSDRILALSGGRVLACGAPRETLTDALISKLYGIDVEVCSLREDGVRVCIPV